MNSPVACDVIPLRLWIRGVVAMNVTRPLLLSFNAGSRRHLIFLTNSRMMSMSAHIQKGRVQIDDEPSRLYELRYYRGRQM